MATIKRQHSRHAKAMFTNPVIWEDLPDMEIIRIGGKYFMSASSFAFSPGAPILESHNLVDWKYIGHSVPDLSLFGERFRLDGQHAGAYGKGVWASTLKYRKSNGLFYWYGAIQGTERTFPFIARSPEGPWDALPPLDKFYYDLGLLIDVDDTFYLAYGTKDICVARLSADGLNEVESRVVYTSDEYLEGARMYNINGSYYIWLTKPYAGQYVLKSSQGPFGPYECRQVIGEILSPIPGSGYPHQGAIVDTPKSGWFCMAFMDGYPGGRVPVLAPVTFTEDGWPEVEADYSTDPGGWKLEYPRMIEDSGAEMPGGCFRRHLFADQTLDHCWEWNHSPDNSKWSLRNGGLILRAGTVTNSLYLATNTLTHRTIGPNSMATFCIEVSQLADGDRSGVSMFRDKSAYIGIHRDAGVTRLVYVEDLTISPITTPTGWMNGHPVALDWSVKENGCVKAEASLDQSRVWLRVKADITPAFSHGYEKQTRYATFEYSYDGDRFSQLGPGFALTNEPTGYVGYRFGLFNFATRALGGQLFVEECEISPCTIEGF